ncbi:hypothetical protein B0H12DRAFT_1240610 [Mycena haematopus]|nr:hypothetical protein B0H12DRAFT_1240610 [Mycena haematopus]
MEPPPPPYVLPAPRAQEDKFAPPPLERRIINANRVPWIVPPQIMAPWQKTWSKWEADEVNNEGAFVFRGRRYRSESSCTWYDREHGRLLYLGHYTLPAGLLDVARFGAPAPPLPFFIMDGTRARPAPPSRWMYQNEKAPQWEVGKEMEVPNADRLPLVEGQDEGLAEGKGKAKAPGKEEEDQDAIGMDVDAEEPRQAPSNIITVQGLDANVSAPMFRQLAADHFYQSHSPPLAILRGQGLMWVRFEDVTCGRRAFGSLANVAPGVTVAFRRDKEFDDAVNYTHDVWTITATDEDDAAPPPYPRTFRASATSSGATPPPFNPPAFSYSPSPRPETANVDPPASPLVAALAISRLSGGDDVGPASSVSAPLFPIRPDLLPSPRPEAVDVESALVATPALISDRTTSSLDGGDDMGPPSSVSAPPSPIRLDSLPPPRPVTVDVESAPVSTPACLDCVFSSPIPATLRDLSTPPHIPPVTASTHGTCKKVTPPGIRSVRPRSPPLAPRAFLEREAALSGLHLDGRVSEWRMPAGIVSRKRPLSERLAEARQGPSLSERAGFLPLPSAPTASVLPLAVRLPTRDHNPRPKKQGRTNGYPQIPWQRPNRRGNRAGRVQLSAEDETTRVAAAEINTTITWSAPAVLQSPVAPTSGASFHGVAQPVATGSGAAVLEALAVEEAEVDEVDACWSTEGDEDDKMWPSC